MKQQFIKRPGCLMPFAQEGEEWLTKVKNGDVIEVEVRRPRNQGPHRKWWALCSYLAEHSDRFPSAEHASKWVLIRMGYCTQLMVRTPVENGVYGSIPIADSISFANMDEDEFERMYSKACDLLCEIIPHVTNENVRQELERFAGVATEIRG